MFKALNIAYGCMIAAAVLLAAGGTGCSHLNPWANAETVLLGAGQTEGWTHVGDGGFDVDPLTGVVTSHGGTGALVYIERPFADFTLHVQFKQNNHECDSGVFVRSPFPEGEYQPMREGYQIEIGPVRNDSKQGMAAIDNIAAPINNVPLKPAGQWNDLKITCIGQHYTIALNGVPTTSYTGDIADEGYIGLQNHDPGSIVQFRDLRIREE